MPKTILLVDDDATIRDLYQQILTSAGYTVDIAPDGKTGWEKIVNGKYDLILLDIMMPQLDGIGILDLLQAKKVTHGPILMMTNLLNDPITKDLPQKGALGYITKVHLDPDQFLKAIQGYLK